MIKGIHHFSLKCAKGDEYKRVIAFYSGLLGIPVLRTWGDENEPDGVLLDTGGGIIEVFANRADEPQDSIIRHIALGTDSVDECVHIVREAGYEIFIEPKDITSPFMARIAFCFGPTGEQIEFFQAI